MDRDKWTVRKVKKLNVITGKREELLIIRLERGDEWYLNITYDKDGNVRYLNSNSIYINNLGAIFLKAEELIRKEGL
ncbi:hypothetical protein ES702_06529 [subsurface metagenome]